VGCKSGVCESGFLAGCQEGFGGDEAENGEKCEVETEGWRESLMAFDCDLFCILLEFGGPGVENIPN
jgi:hypothetical protein